MKRRSFFRKTSAALAGIGLTTHSLTESNQKKIKKPIQVCATIDQHKVFFYAEVIKESIKVIHIADTHLFTDDERGIQYVEFSNRMAKAYNQTTHFITREKNEPGGGL